MTSLTRKRKSQRSDCAIENAKPLSSVIYNPLSAPSAQISTRNTLGTASDLTTRYTPWDVQPRESRARIITIITPTAPPPPSNGEFTRLARNLPGTSVSYACSSARGGSGRVFTPMHFTAPAPEVTGARRPRNRAMSATSPLSRRMPTVNILGFDLLKFACPTLALVRKKSGLAVTMQATNRCSFTDHVFLPPFPRSLSLECRDTTETRRRNPPY